MKKTRSEYIDRATAEAASAKGASTEQRGGKTLLVRHGVMCAVLFGILILALSLSGTFGWFSVNKKVGATGMLVTPETLPFDIATKGELARNYSVLNQLRPEYTEGTVKGDYHQADTLILRFDPIFEDNTNTVDVDERYLPNIGPGSSGELSFYVVPRVDDQLDMKITLNIVAFAEIDEYTEQTETVTDENGETSEVKERIKTGKKIVEIKNVDDFKQQAEQLLNSEASAEADEYIKAADYLRGHIMFFGENGDTANENEAQRYYYKTPYTGRVVETEIAGGKKGTAVQIPIYWMWPNTFGQIALPNNSSGQRSGYPILQDKGNDKALILAYLKSEIQNVFTNANIVTADDISAVAADVAAESFNSDVFNKLSQGYNHADFAIGTRIAYFMIEVVVEAV